MFQECVTTCAVAQGCVSECGVPQVCVCQYYRLGVLHIVVIFTLGLPLGLSFVVYYILSVSVVYGPVMLLQVIISFDN